MDHHHKEDFFPRRGGRFGKSTCKTLRYCPNCIHGESKSAEISVLGGEGARINCMSGRVVLSMNKKKRWEIIPSDILCPADEKKTDGLMTTMKKKKKTKTFTTPQKHWRSEIGFYHLPDVKSFYYARYTKWSKPKKAYDTKPIPLAMEDGDVHKYKISMLFHNEIPKEVPLYILENTHTLWEQSKLYDVNVNGSPFLEWHLGCGEFMPSGWWGKNWKDATDKEKVVVILPTRKNVGRWCCCKKGKTGDNYGERNVYGYGKWSAPYMERKRKKGKSRRNRIVNDIFLNVK